MVIKPHELAKRNSSLYHICQQATSVGIDVMYQIEYRHEERLLPYKDSPFILLPKHQSIVDIILEGQIMQKVLGRQGYFVMKTELPDWFRYLGGIKITRAKDLKKDAMTDREKVKQAIEQRNQVYDCIRSVYDTGEIVVIHPEGERNYRQSAPINASIIKRLVRLATTKELLFFPLNIVYEDVRRFRSRITATIGEPIATKSAVDLETHLVKEISLLTKSTKE